MICANCFGTGKEPFMILKSNGQLVGYGGERICEACQGSGREHCCEGHCSANDRDAEDDDDQ